MAGYVTAKPYYINSYPDIQYPENKYTIYLCLKPQYRGPGLGGFFRLRRSTGPCRQVYLRQVTPRSQISPGK
ncbi:hypothetical protein hamaS1_18560 [Moorella sp. Hama-1]|nr:hypothetical protein hamaS1_18560 [Moorella sp. Hama-1]